MTAIIGNIIWLAMFAVSLCFETGKQSKPKGPGVLVSRTTWRDIGREARILGIILGGFTVLAYAVQFVSHIITELSICTSS